MTFVEGDVVAAGEETGEFGGRVDVALEVGKQAKYGERGDVESHYTCVKGTLPQRCK